MQTINQLQVVEYKNQRILTTEQLAEVYETDVNNIQKNFSNHKENFIAGIHYYYLEGEELKAFKSHLNDIQPPFINKFASNLYLWTERGANRHCKILDTDKAWEQFDNLEETYFKVKDILNLNDLLPELKSMFPTLEQYNLLSDRVSKYEKSTIDYKQSERLRRLGAERVINLFGGKTADYKEHSKKVFFELWKDYKKHFHVTSYKDIPIEKYEEGLKFVSTWESTENIIDSMAIQEVLQF